MDFPIADLMDEGACSAKLVLWFHPDGFACPRCHCDDRMAVHRRRRPPVLDDRCGHRRRVFHGFTATSLPGAKRRPSEVVLILRGFARGVPTARLARELGCDRSELLKLRHRFQDAALRGRDRTPLEEAVAEADEAYQDAGEKGVPHDDPEAPPRRRANKVRGHGTWDNDRPPVCGVAGRESGQIRLTVAGHSDGETLEHVVGEATVADTMMYTAEWGGYNGLPAMGRGQATVCHRKGEWARDDDGDGEREVHDNTLEGLWTGLRNFLRMFRGVGKKYLQQDVAMFEWGDNVKRATPRFLGALLGVAATTTCTT